MSQALDSLRQQATNLQALLASHADTSPSDALAQLQLIKANTYECYKNLEAGEFVDAGHLMPLDRLAELQQHYERKQEQE